MTPYLVLDQIGEVVCRQTVPEHDTPTWDEWVRQGVLGAGWQVVPGVPFDSGMALGHEVNWRSRADALAGALSTAIAPGSDPAQAMRQIQSALDDYATACMEAEMAAAAVEPDPESEQPEQGPER